MNNHLGINFTCQTAAIDLPDIVYYSSYQPKPYEPHSATTQLIQGIYQLFPGTALKILRHPIILNYNPSILCQGMISISAKRYRIDPHFLQNQLYKPMTSIAYNNDSCHSENRLSISSPFNLNDIKEWIKNSDPHSPKMKRIRAVLFDSNNTLILNSEKNSHLNRTLHAEVLLLQKYYSLYQQGFSKPTTLMTSLQSCRMCSAMWWHMHIDPWKNLQSIYVQPELGRSARDTILTSGGNRRRQIARNDQELFQIFEHPL